MNNNFQPNWASSPGNTISFLLREKNISLENFSAYLKLSSVETASLIYGELKITVDLAKALSESLGSSENFWFNREKNYRASIEKLNEVEEQKFVKELPVKEMKKLGWVSEKDNNIKSYLNFFGVPDVWTWKNKYRALHQSTSFRSSNTYESNFMAVCAWLRKGELQAQITHCKIFNPALFKESLPEIKKLSKRKNPKTFLPDLQRICAECGVALSIVPTPRGCTASGATITLQNGTVMLLLSFRYLSDDQFWFTFFHEAGHILLHKDQKLTIEEKDFDGLDTIEEKEANAFASEVIISSEKRKELRDLPLTQSALVKFAFENDISVGLLIGQMQHAGLIEFKQLNGYKRRYKWEDIL